MAKLGRPKGIPKTGGRAKGTPNKVTRDFREALNRLLEESAPHFAEWLKAVPAERRLELIGKLAEYAHPKLARSEVTGSDGGPLIIEFPPIPGA